MLNRPLPAPARDLAMLVARVILGVVLFAHGWQKLMINGISGTYGQFEKLGIPLAIVSASFASFVEFVGGVLIVLGALTTAVVALDLVVMVGAAGFVHMTHGIFAQNGGWELVGVIVAAELALAAFGPGRFSVDHLIARHHDRERAEMQRREQAPVIRAAAVSETFTPAADLRPGGFAVDPASAGMPTGGFAAVGPAVPTGVFAAVAPLPGRVPTGGFATVAPVAAGAPTGRFAAAVAPGEPTGGFATDAVAAAGVDRPVRGVRGRADRRVPSRPAADARDRPACHRGLRGGARRRRHGRTGGCRGRRVADRAGGRRPVPAHGERGRAPRAVRAGGRVRPTRARALRRHGAVPARLHPDDGAAGRHPVSRRDVHRHDHGRHVRPGRPPAPRPGRRPAARVGGTALRLTRTGAARRERSRVGRRTTRQTLGGRRSCSSCRPTLRDVLALGARLLLGVVLLAHGWQKLVGEGLGATSAGFARLGVPAPGLVRGLRRLRRDRRRALARRRAADARGRGAGRVRHARRGLVRRATGSPASSATAAGSWSA